MNPDMAASIRQRLLNLAHNTGQDFQRVLDQFVLERVLYRLSQSEHQSLFVLKGATLYYLAGGRSPRPTRDLDLMAWVAPGHLQQKRNPLACRDSRGHVGEVCPGPPKDPSVEWLSAKEWDQSRAGAAKGDRYNSHLHLAAHEGLNVLLA